jgi:AcrR family transcriptional regulator
MARKRTTTPSAPAGSGQRKASRSKNGVSASGDRPKRDAELLRVAADVFWRKGYSAATVQDIADAMGVLKGSLYYYIESKEELLFRVFDESHRDAVQIVDAVRDLEAPPIERLRAFLESYVAFYLENIERVSLYFRDWRYLTGKRRRIVIEQRAVYEDFTRQLLSEAQDNGDIPEDIDIRHAMFFFFGAINGTPDWYRRTGADTPKQIAASYTRLALGAVTAAPLSA